MSLRSYLSFILLLLLFVSAPLVALSPRENLQEESVTKVMEQLFDFHVDAKKMTPLLMARSWRVFLDHFDPKRTYLLYGEVQKFLEPSEAMISKEMKRYNDHDLSSFWEMNALFQDSIYQVRVWRQEWKRDLRKLFVEAEEMKELGEDREVSDEWLLDKGSLKQRNRDQLLNFIISKLEEDSPLTTEKQNKIFGLYEKRVRSNENELLFVDEDGNTYDVNQQRHNHVLRVIKAMAKSLDSHTAFFSGQEAYDMRIQLEKGFQGIGVILQEGLEGVTITRLIKGGPAEKSGLVQVDDTIVVVDGQRVESYPFKKVLDLIRGEGDSVVKLGLKRTLKEGGELTDVELEIELTRGKVVLDEKRVDVSYETYGDGIVGKIVLYSFYDGEEGVSSEKDIRAAIQELKQKGEIKGLVLDLRENLGGFLMQAVKVTGLFITNGVVVVAKYSDGEIKYFRDIDGYSYYDGPLVVLVSKASASAAEIVAQTLQDYGSAVIVGDEHTYGKGSIQHQTVTNENAEAFFKVTVGRYYTVSGRSTQIEGVISDIVVPTKFYDRQIGESFLDYPLPSDTISASYDDLLVDLGWDSRQWYMKYYVPTLQQRTHKWKEMLPTLRENSLFRINNNKNFQFFLEEMSGETAPIDEEEPNRKEADDFGVRDLQMQEAVNVLKDMIILEPKYQDRDVDAFASKMQKLLQ